MRWTRPGYALALALVVTGPLLAPGYLLLRDAVSTPRSYVSDTALGLTSAPRATPQDFAVALASHVVDGGLVVKALLILGVWLAGWGASRLVATALPAAGGPGQLVAATLAIWNPYVAERLLQGHWSLLLGYGCLPWVATAMLSLRSEAGAGRLGFFGLAFWIALAGLTPSGLLLAAAVALACLAAPFEGPGRRWRCAAAASGAALVGALPWLTAAAMGSSLASHTAANALGVDAFAARAEPGLGTLASLASLGGIWNAQAVPDSRATLFAVWSAAALLGVVAVGLPAVVRRREVAPLLGLAAVCVLVPAALATGPGRHLLATVVDAVPGFGVLRDGQKWVALAMPGYAVAGAGTVLTLRRCRPEITAPVCCVALILALPDLAWGVWGRVSPVHYPPGWAAVAAAINADPRAVAVLPAGTMRRFSWSGPPPVLDPLPRWVRAEVLTTGDLVISGSSGDRVVPGEGGHARVVQELLLAGPEPSALAPAGVGWLVVEADSAGDMGAAARTLGTLTPVYRDRELTLYRIGGDTAGVSPGRRRATVIAHLAWLALLVGSGAGAVVTRWRRLTPRQ